LLRGERHHVHLSATPELAHVVGQRRGHPVILEVRAAEMAAAGHELFLTPNGVWLTTHVPPEYLRRR
jgi:putative RNA 2'-phosphotransferase